MNKFRIVFYTGNRAEFSLIRPLIESVRENNNLATKLIVSGAHVDPKYGNTLKEIKESGIEVNFLTEKLNSEKLSNSTPSLISKSIEETCKAIEDLKPSLLIIYADRYETFGACIAASQQGIPVLHIEGGDITEGGCLDDNVRHAITKLSHLHCTTTEESRKRVIVLGEENWRVKNIGLPSLDDIYKENYATPKEIIKKFDLDLSRPIIVFTQHTVSSELGELNEHIKHSILALDRLSKELSAQVICTYPNNDEGSELIIDNLKLFESKNKSVRLFKSLGGYFYHGILALSKEKNVRMVSIGNSSSGIKETACFGLTHLNVGNRQRGRTVSLNVINVPYDKEEIFSKAKNSILSSASHLKLIDPYYCGGAAENFSSFINEISKIKIQKILVKSTYKTTLSFSY